MHLLGVFILKLYSATTSKNNPLNKNSNTKFPNEIYLMSVPNSLGVPIHLQCPKSIVTNREFQIKEQYTECYHLGRTVRCLQSPLGIVGRVNPTGHPK